MLDIYRGSIINLNLHIDDNTRLIRQLLGEDIIKSTFSYHIILDIAIGDYIIFDDVKYYINNLPNIKKNSSNSFDYDITFESEYYELLKTQFLDSDGNSDFSLVGNLETFIDLIIANMNRIYSGWGRGACDQTNMDYKLLSFSKSNCMQVLQQLCEEFEGEFFFDFEMYWEGGGGSIPYLPAADAVIPYKPAAEGEHYYEPTESLIAYYSKKDICFTDKAGSDSGLTFLYRQGLRNIQRTTLSDKNIVTRLYAFGSRKNLASDYRDHSTRLKFVDGGFSFLEKNVDKYGTIEHTEIFEDIYPHRDGTVSSIDGGDILKFFDSGMDFNLNDYLLPGVTAKLHFNSGNLGGYEFEVSAYNNSTKGFTIIAFTDEIGYAMPNATLKPAVGDKYVLLDIKMPQSYIDTAETALQAKAQAYLDDNCEPRVTYILEPDWRYFQLHFISLEVGDFITIQDTDLGIDIMTRIIELTKSVANKYKYTLKLTDHLEVQLIQRMYSEQEDLKQKIEIGEGGDVIRSRRNWRTSEELRNMIFDTDGYFDMGKIRPESVETSMLSVGAKSTQFILSGVEIEGNYTADVSKFHASAGNLIHLSIADEIRTWVLFENSQNDLVDGTAYYIYAKCTKEPGYTGQIIVDSEQRKFDDDPTYYYFLIGVLHSVVDSVRGVSLTYGQTIINGRFIKTGKIESTDGLTYFDLDNAIIHGKMQFIANTSGYANISDKPDLSIYNGKAKVFRQATAPTIGMQTGDIWIDTDDGDRPRSYNGAIWVLMYTIIDGGNIETGTITADSLTALTITGDKIAATTITAAKIAAGTITADKLAAGTITGDKIAAGAITASNIAAGTITATQIASSTITGTKIAATTITADKIAANAIETDKINALAVTAAKIAAGTITADKIAAGTITATQIAAGTITADKLNITTLSAITANLGTITAGTISGTRLRIGGGTDEDIYFEDSGIRLLDNGSQVIAFYKSGYAQFQIQLEANTIRLQSTSTCLRLSNSGTSIYFYSGGQFQLVNRTSAPSGYSGALVYNSGSARFAGYIGGEGWGHWLLSSGW